MEVGKYRYTHILTCHKTLMMLMNVIIFQNYHNNIIIIWIVIQNPITLALISRNSLNLIHLITQAGKIKIQPNGLIFGIII